jgi:hypothetical protein
MYAFYIAYALEQMENILAHIVFMLLTSYGFFYNLLSLSPPLRGFNSGSGRNQMIMDIQVFSHSITSYLPSVFLPNQTRLFMLWIGVFAAIALLLIYSAKFSHPNEL